MAGLIWLTPAVDDLVEITKKAELKSEKYAERLAKQLFNKPNILKAMPEMGRRVPEMEHRDPNIREIFESRYRIMYRYDGETVYILKIQPSNSPLITF